ncbi:putative peptide/nitrate transporter-like [Capsicum annuum]|nr:putative peptide/nitrate transporter-like [Capsicum annuum]KAF3683120.1 putative peptide/nitrate transporter-like [Capsicum annuum]
MALRSRIYLITTDTPDWTCEVQIADISPERKSPEKQMLFQNLLLEDEEGQQIRVAVYGDDIAYYADKLVLLNTYLISAARIPKQMVITFATLRNTQFLLTLWGGFSEIEGPELCTFQIDLTDATGLTTTLISGALGEKILSMTAEDIFDTTCVKRIAKKVKPLATSEQEMEPTIVESGSASATLAPEPLTSAKKKLRGTMVLFFGNFYVLEKDGIYVLTQYEAPSTALEAIKLLQIYREQKVLLPRNLASSCQCSSVGDMNAVVKKALDIHCVIELHSRDIERSEEIQDSRGCWQIIGNLAIVNSNFKAKGAGK